MTKRVGKIVCRVTRAERYDCGHVTMWDRAYEPTREFAHEVRCTGPCPGCRKLAEWKALSEATP